MTALYQLTSEFKELANLDLEPEIIADTLEGLQLEFNEKASNIVAVGECLNGDVVAIDSAIKRLQERKERFVKRQNQLKQYLLDNMVSAQINKIEHPLFTIALRNGIEVVKVDDADALPDDFVTVKTTISPNKAAIKKAIKDGAEVPGARLERNPKTLTIK